MQSRPIPKFANEAEEAKWWHDHRDEISQDIVTASYAGKLAENSRERFERKTAEREREKSGSQHAASGHTAK